MNAYELADWLDNIPVNDFESLDQHHYTRKAANMLRQQADRIGVLEANHEIQKNINDKALQYIAELEKQLHHQQEQSKIYKDNLLEAKKLFDKKLTDQEIMEVYKQISEPFGEKRLYEIHDFARAIEAKVRG